MTISIDFLDKNCECKHIDSADEDALIVCDYHVEQIRFYNEGYNSTK